MKHTKEALKFFPCLTINKVSGLNIQALLYADYDGSPDTHEH